MGELSVYKEPPDTRSLEDSSDSIATTLSIVDHNGDTHAVEVCLIQEQDGPVELSWVVLEGSHKMTYSKDKLGSYTIATPTPEER